MAFFDERFPDSIAQGASGGPRIKVTSVKSGSGARYANRDWAQPQHVYEVSQGNKLLTDFELLRAFWLNAVPDSFRFKDFTNFRVSQAAGVMQAIVAGSTYQLHKAETFKSRTWLRKIRKPVAGTVTVYRTRSGITTGIGASVDHSTGIVTVAGHLSGDTYAWSGEFDVPCYFVSDTMEQARQVGSENGLIVEWPSIQIEEDKLA